MSGEINRINPTVVEGAEDIHGAESFDADYSPMNRPAFSWRDNMAQSRKTLSEKQVGDMMRMRRMGRGKFGAEDDDDDDDDDDLDDCQVCGEMFHYLQLNQHPETNYTVCYHCFENELEEDDEGWVDVEDFSWGGYEKKAEAPLSKEQLEKLKRRISYSKGSRPNMRPIENRLAVGQRMKGSMASEGIGSVLGTLIPHPHFIGFEEVQREKMKNQNMKDAESCGNCGNALVMNAEGEHGCGCGTEMEAEETMLGSIGEGNDFGQMEAETFGAEREDYLKRLGNIWYKGSSGNEDFYGSCYQCKNDLSAYDPGYVASDKDFALCMPCFGEGDTPKLMDAETFESEERMCLVCGCKEDLVFCCGDYWCNDERCSTKERRSDEPYPKSEESCWAKHADYGYCDGGWRNAETFGAERRYRYGNRYITRDSKGRFKKNVDVGRSLSADRRRKAKTVKGVGQGGKGDYGAEETMLGSIGEGNDFGQMEAEDDVVDLTQSVLSKGGVRVGGMTASAIVLAIAGLSGYYYARR